MQSWPGLLTSIRQVKLQSCPSCKKPLPRCAVCLVNMGTASGTALLAGDEDKDKSVLYLCILLHGSLPKPVVSRSPPGWCPSLVSGSPGVRAAGARAVLPSNSPPPLTRHGGHAAHLLHWFSLHSDCPVTGCSCRSSPWLHHPACHPHLPPGQVRPAGCRVRNRDVISKFCQEDHENTGNYGAKLTSDISELCSCRSLLWPQMPLKVPSMSH